MVHERHSALNIGFNWALSSAKWEFLSCKAYNGKSMGEDRTSTVVDVAGYDEIFLYKFQNRANQVMMFSIFLFFGSFLLSLFLELWLWFGLYIPLNRNQMQEMGC